MVGIEKTKCIIIGAGGHAEVVLEILGYDKNIEVIGFIDDLIEYPTTKTVGGLPILGGISIIPKLAEEGVTHAIVAVGENYVRKVFSERAQGMGMKLVRAIHPQSIISPTAAIGNGGVLAAGAIICSYAKIGDNTIINTGSVVEHHVEIGKNTHIGPSVKIAGRTKIGDNVFIGIGATIIDNIRIGDNTVVGAGAVVIKNLPSNVVAVGVPANIIRERDNNEPVFAPHNPKK